MGEALKKDECKWGAKVHDTLRVVNSDERDREQGGRPPRTGRKNLPEPKYR